MTEQSKPRLLILYGSQTGNAQDVAERVAREASLMLYAPSIMPMDGYPLQQLPEERYVVFVTSTTGQGDPPDNMRKFWKLLLRKNLPPNVLSGVSYAVFGLGDSGYVKYNVAAMKLDRRLAALGAVPLMERGLGDDQHPSGYEASLDPWLQQLWIALRLKCPLPPGVEQPAMDEVSLLQLGPPKYKVAYLTTPQQHSNITKQQQYQQQLAAAPDPATAEQIREQQLIEEAAAAAVAFRAVAAEASGMNSSSTSTSAAPGLAAGTPKQDTSPCYGPWQPFMAPLVVNQRVTAADHFQDTRHIEFDLEGSGLSYEPGDLLCIFPRTPAADVEAALSLLGLDGDSWVRIEAAEQQQHQHGQQQGALKRHKAVCEAPVRAVLQGVLDLSGTSPRRYLFQVLSHFTDNSLHKDRLQYFATAEGRDDLYRYNQRERRSLLEVLQDFSSAKPPLEWLLAATPLLGPRQFSLASAQSAHGDRAAILMAVVSWNTPTKRPRRGLLTHWLAGLQPGRQGLRAAAAVRAGNCSAKCAQQQQQLSNGLQENSALQDSLDLDRQVLSRVPVWVEEGALRLPPVSSTPLLMVGPGTGVAPFRSFCWHRAAVRQLQDQQQRQEDWQSVSAASNSMLFFGCRTPTADFYYEHEWLQLMQQGALHEQHGLVVAFSRHQPQPDQQQLLKVLQKSQELHRQGPADSPVVQYVNGPTAPSSGKVYVTHKLHQHGAEVWQLLSEHGAWVYVSGSAEKMPANVVSAFEEIAMVQGGLSAAAAAKFVRQLELTGRYHVEAWS